ncbi:multifunctional expression regulator; ICP27 [pteropodid alphaherpesvirus 2]|uniref:Multifunctional expression regulator ICP27 n=1 Tax=pteropodid alphaherpesvirus 2 TaxID=3118716 RepID=A0A510J6W7_9ALPH|nr:multifunctional expression regulator; ICP27 [pteropodid alphaherpesvirus 2]BBM13227.1 multifunctional expression regulator; ICP27 [pteropodid alphaherpesvirus 2]
MSSNLDMLIDLGLDLSDSEFEEDPVEPEGARSERRVSTSSGQCSSSDEDMEDSDTEAMVEQPDEEERDSRANWKRESSAPTAVPVVFASPSNPLPTSEEPRLASSVWTRLGPRRSRAPSGSRAGKMARLAPPAAPAAQPAPAASSEPKSKRPPGRLLGETRHGARHRFHRGSRGGRGRRVLRQTVFTQLASGMPPTSTGSKGLPQAACRQRVRPWESVQTRAHFGTPQVGGRPHAPPRPVLVQPPPLMALRIPPPVILPAPETLAPGPTKPVVVDVLDPAAMGVIRSISERAAAERITESFGRSAQAMAQPFGSSAFPTLNSPWAPVLGVSVGPYDADARRVPWETLAEHGPSLYATFKSNLRAASVAKALRECVLRQENLIEALASADELLAWCKMCIQHNLPLRPQDPIIGTARAVLDTLVARLRPFLQCYLRTRGLCSLDELCGRRRLADIKEIASFTFVMLARLANRLERGFTEIDYATLGVTPGAQMDFYIPGTCMAGLIEILDTHRQECSSRICELTASHLIAPPYVHGKYFYCNSLF